ncbi:MAG: T9SS type A sorting domain-containing protein, partial [Chlorobi bacterium]|nr:T9SS type A sorting domain-containing protein [Chlorobiota bacterium]
FLVFLIVIPVFAQWEWQMPRPTGAALTDVGSFAPDAVFMVGLNGTIIKTTDGGNSFTQIESGTNQFLKTIYCINEDVGWISSDSGLVLRTENGGDTWETVRYPGNTGQSSFFALDHRHAWLSTENGMLRRTIDGGNSWLNIVTGIGKNFGPMAFADPTTGFATINESSSGDVFFPDTAVLKTGTGGKTWDTLELIFHDNINFIETFGGTHVWIGTRGYILKSGNLGQTWDTVWLPGNRFEKEAISVTFRSPDTAWLLCVESGDFIYYHTIYYTTDGGLSWEKQYEIVDSNWSSDCNNSLKKLNFAFDKCWAVGSPGIITSFTDSDAEWEDHYQIPNGVIRDIFFIDSQNGYATGNLFTFLKTQDGGKTWEDGGDLPGEYGYKVYYQNKDRGFVSVTEQGLYLTNDGSQTWEKVLESEGFLVTIRFIDDMNGWVLNSKGPLYQTSDGGDTWQQQSTLPTSDYNYWMDLVFLDPGKGFAAGSQGIWETTDGGDNWQAAFSPGPDMNSIYFIDEQTGWAVGDEGLICKTTDGGDTWVIKDTLLNSPLYDIRFINKQTGYLISDGYGVFRTSDGGENWVFEPVFGLPLKATPGYWNGLTTSDNGVWIIYNCQIMHKTDQTTGILSGQATPFEKLILYPNPAHNLLNIKSKNSILDLTIINLNGQVLINVQSSGSTLFQQDITLLKPGIYFVKIRTEKGITVRKFVKLSR